MYDIFRFQADGTWHAIWDKLYPMLRDREDREGSPSAGIIDSQTVESAEKGAVAAKHRPPTRPTQWVVERTFSWLGRDRRLAKDFETLAATLPAFVTLAAIQFGIRRLARS